MWACDRMLKSEHGVCFRVSLLDWLCKAYIPCRNFILHCSISGIIFKAFIQINACLLETYGFF